MSPQTMRAYSSDVNQFLIWTQGAGIDNRSRNLNGGMTDELVREWLQDCRHDVAPKTHERRMLALRSYMKFMGWSEPLYGYKFARSAPSVPHPLDGGMDDVRKMLDQCRNNEERALIAFCGFGGLRISEARAMRTRDIDFINRMLTVRGKGDKTRTVPMSKSMCDILAFVDTDPNVLLVSYSDRGARYAITRLADQAGIEQAVSSHDLRATLATAAHDKTGNLRAVQELLGHASITTTQCYTRVSMDQMRTAVDF